MGKLRHLLDDDEGSLASINIIPFVDIVLVLLVIFMVTSTTIVRASFVVELPRAASAGSKVEATINLVYTRQGELLVDGTRSASREEVGRLIRGQTTANPNVQAVIAADTGVDYGRVVELIDLVKHNGIKTFALDIERSAGPEPSRP